MRERGLYFGQTLRWWKDERPENVCMLHALGKNLSILGQMLLFISNFNAKWYFWSSVLF